MSHQAFLDFRHVTYLARVDGWRRYRAAMRECLVQRACYRTDVRGPRLTDVRQLVLRSTSRPMSRPTPSWYRRPGTRRRNHGRHQLLDPGWVSRPVSAAGRRSIFNLSPVRCDMAPGRSPCARSTVATPSADAIVVYVVCAYAMMRVAHRIVFGNSLRCAAGVSAGSTSPTLTGLHHALRR